MSSGNGCDAIVCGFGHLGSRIAAILRERGFAVSVVEKSADDFLRAKVESLGCRLIEGDCREDMSLLQAGADSACCFIAATGDDQANLESAISVRQMNASISVVARIFDQDLAARVETMFGIRALSASALASPAFISIATDDSIISSFTVDGCHLSLRGGCAKCDTKHPVMVKVHKKGPQLRTVNLQEADDAECLLIGLHQTARGARAAGRHKPKRAKTALGKLRAHLSYLNPRKLASELYDAWAHAPDISRALLSALLFMSILSVVVFSVAAKMAPIDALYFVITTMTTVGYGDFNLQNVPLGLKIYGIGMMLCGAALLTTVYAIIADRVTTARIEHMLGRKVVNLKEHYVVVGLGKVGYRVAHDLKMLGLDVAAVEANADSDNVNTARTVFPVVIGDASRKSVLDKAGIAEASVILALTDDPMLNLSVALQALERNPSIKTVLRTYDFDLAEKFSSLGLEVLSTSAIAAPAFADAASYPGVLGSFKWDGDDILLARLTVGEDSPLNGMSVEAVGKKLDIAVALTSEQTCKCYRAAKPEAILEAGTRVVALLSRERVAGLAKVT